MEKIIEQCVNDGVCAGQAALVGQGGQLWGEVVAHLEDWAAGFSPEPTDDMVAAWMVGFSGVLTQHFELLQKD